MGKSSAHKIFAVTSKFDVEESRGYLDTQEFADYCILVHDVIHANPQGLWLAGIERGLGDQVNHRWTCDALASLQAIGTVTESFNLPTLYLPSEPKPKPEKYYNTDKRGSAHRNYPRPDAESVYGSPSGRDFEKRTLRGK